MKKLITDFIMMPTDEVLSKFADLENSYYFDGVGYGERFVLVGGRSDVLIVAHADTVWEDNISIPTWSGNIMYGESWGTTSVNKKWGGSKGVGADCRAGCAMAWHLATELGASVLITDGEESGGIGAEEALVECGLEIEEDYAFMIELDRRNDMEVACYHQSSTDDFEDYLLKMLPVGWRLSNGSYTDIATIAPGTGVPGVNLSVGYRYEHTSNEILVLDAWERTRVAVEELVLNEDHPRMRLPQTWVDKYASRLKGSRFYDYSSSVVGDEWKGGYTEEEKDYYEWLSMNKRFSNSGA